MSLKFETDIAKVPTETKSILENTNQLLRYSQLGLRQDLGEGDLKIFSSKILEYLIEQLNHFLKVHEDSSISELSLTGRNIVEIYAWINFALHSKDNLEKYFLLEVLDYQELGKMWFTGIDRNDLDEDLKGFSDSITKMNEWVQSNGYEVGKRPNVFELIRDYGDSKAYKMFKTLSKFVHPTPLLLFGKHNFVHGEATRNGVKIIIQYVSAIILQELPEKVQALK